MFNIHTMSCSDADYQPGTPESWSSGTIGSDDDIELLLLGQPRKPTPYEIDREEYERTHLAPMLQQVRPRFPLLLGPPTPHRCTHARDPPLLPHCHVVLLPPRCFVCSLPSQMATIDNCDSDPGYLDASRFSDDDSEDAEAAAAGAGHSVGCLGLGTAQCSLCTEVASSSASCAP